MANRHFYQGQCPPYVRFSEDLPHIASATPAATAQRWESTLRHKKKVMRDFDKNWQRNLSVLESLARFVADRKARLYLMEQPLLQETIHTAYRDSRDKLWGAIAASSLGPTLANPVAVDLQRPHFIDPVHMNRVGRARWTPALIEMLRQRHAKTEVAGS